MKRWTLTVLLLMGTSMAMARTRHPQSTFKSDDFNQMIQENQKAEARLRSRLQEKAGIHLDDDKPGTLSREKFEIPSEPEQVVVNTSDSIWRHPSRKDRPGRALDKADMKRVAEELQEASH